MEPTGEKPDSRSAAQPATWTIEEKNERSELFLIAGVIVVVGLGVFSIGAAGLLIWVRQGPDLYVDIFLCSLAMFLGLLLASGASYGWYRLLRMKPAHVPPKPDYANSRH